MPIPPPGYGINTNGQIVNMADIEQRNAALRKRGEGWMRTQRRLEGVGKAATAAIIGAGAVGAAGGFGSGAASVAPATTIHGAPISTVFGSSLPSVAPSVGTAARWTLPNILKMAEVGVPAVTGVIGMRSQNRALDRQAAAEQASLAEQMTFAREQEAQRRAEAERMFVEDQRRWEAEERNRAREIQAAEEERAFTRSQQEYQRQLLEAREAARAPLRAAAGPALIRLQQLMAMGRRR